MGKKLLVFLSLIFLSTQIFARNISFQLVQHHGSLKSVSESALVLEDELLNKFFATGHIVTNIPAVMSDSLDQDKKLLQRGLEEAAMGGSDNFIQIILHFNEDENMNSQKASLGLLNKVSWKAISVRNGKVVEELTKKVIKPIGSDTEENVRVFASELAGHFNQILK